VCVNSRTDRFQLLVVYVLTGHSKDYGPKKAAELKHAPPGYDSVSGTEMHQRVFPVEKAAKTDRMAARLLGSGHIYGRQFAVFRNDRAYPAYVVTYKMDPVAAQSHRVEVRCGTRRAAAHFEVKGQAVWDVDQFEIALLALRCDSLKPRCKARFDPWTNADDGAKLVAFVRDSVAPDDVVLVAINTCVLECVR
jgi:hypothetical protein